jgi:hypothetical protein
MNQRSDIDRVLQIWLADGPSVMPDRIVDVVADRISVQRQRRAWPFQGRTTVTTPIKLIAALAAALVVAVVGYNLLPSQGGVGGQATPPSTAAPTTAPTTAPPSGPIPLRDGALTEGRYQMEAFGLSIVADIPAGWFGDPYPFLASEKELEEGQVLITFMLVDGLFSDPCHWDLDGTGTSGGQSGDVEVGPTVDDLVDALRANTSYTSSTPSPVTFGPYQGQELEIQLPGDDVLSTCDIELGDSTGSYFVFSGKDSRGIYAQGPDNRWQLFIVDVGGTRLVTLLSYFEATPQADLEAARAIVESFEFTP